MMDKKVERENVLTNLRSVAQSLKGGVPVDRLQEDYRSILGVGIPFRELGYRTLDAFLRDVPEVIKLERGADGKVMALGVADSSTAHIVSLVQRQKASDTRRGRRGRKTPSHYAARVPRYPTRGSGYSTIASQKFNTASSFPTSKQYNSRRSPTPRYVPPARRSSPPRQRSSPPRQRSSPPRQRSSPPRQRSSPPRQRTPPPPRQRTPPPPRQRTPPPDRSPPLRRPVYKKPEVATIQSDYSQSNTISAPKAQSSYRRSNKPEIAPRFLRLQEQSRQSQQVEDDWSPPPSAPTVKPKFPEPVFPMRNLQVHITNVPKAANRNAGLAEALNNARNAKEYVRIYADANRMTSSYKTDRIGQKRKGYVSKLFLGEKTFNSYPVDAHTPEAAEEEAAKKAMDDIKDSRGKTRRVCVMENNTLKIRVMC